MRIARHPWIFLLLLCVAAAPQVSAQTLVQIEGTVQDLDGDPVVGARVVYRLIDSEGVFISLPTDGSGRYALELPSGARCRPVAVVVSDGKTRIALENVAPARAADGMTQQITIDLPRRWNPSAVVQNFPGSDRLFRSFVEDTSIDRRRRFETQVQLQKDDSIDRGRMNVIGSAQFGSIPNVEFGVKLSVVGVNTATGLSGDGVGDTNLWAKYVMGTMSDNRHELAFGVIATLPMGSDSDGAGFDSTGSKLFIAGRREIGWGVLTGNLGVSFNGNGQIFGFGLSGETAFSVNLGVIAPLSYRLTLVGEVGYEGERFTVFDHETTVLTGVNVMLKEGSFRTAVAFGLSDGAPDVEVTVGYVFPF